MRLNIKREDKLSEGCAEKEKEYNQNETQEIVDEEEIHDSHVMFK